VNGWTNVLVEAAQEKADKEDVEVGEVWARMMKNPREVLPELMAAISPESLKTLVPDTMNKAWGRAWKSGQLCTCGHPSCFLSCNST